MGLLDTLQFEPDPELKRFLEAYDKYGPDMPDNLDELENSLAKRSNRPSYRGRTPFNNLTDTRDSQVLTQGQLATKVGTTRRAINAIENGHRQPSVYLAIAIASALECKVEDIFHLGPSTEIPPSKY